MNSAINFLTNNYWILIVGAVVIFMAIVGYFAEKTDFGRKKEKPVEPKLEKEKPVVIKEEKVVEAPAFEMPMVAEEPVLYDETGVEQVETPILDEEVHIDEVEEQPVVEEYTPLYEEPIVEEAPIMEEPAMEQPVVEEPVMEQPIMEEPKLEEVVAAEPISFDFKNEVEDIAKPLPDLDSLKDVNSFDDEDDNDVWKF